VPFLVWLRFKPGIDTVADSRHQEPGEPEPEISTKKLSPGLGLGGFNVALVDDTLEGFACTAVGETTARKIKAKVMLKKPAINWRRVLRDIVALPITLFWTSLPDLVISGTFNARDKSIESQNQLIQTESRNEP
jgi:hypothetical protein